MQNFKKNKIKSLLVIIACSIPMISWMALDSESSNTVKELDGKDYFKAIYFQNGELSKRIYGDKVPNINSDNDIQTAKYEIEKIVFQQIESTNPEFFSEFENLVESNNVNNVKRAIDKGQKTLINTLYTLREADRLSFAENIFESEVANFNNEDECVLYLVVYFAIYYYQAVYTETLGERQKLMHKNLLDKSMLYKDQLAYKVYEQTRL